MKTTRSIAVLTGLSARDLDALARALRKPRKHRGRPWADSLRSRVLLACVALRTNLTLREIAAVFGISKSKAHRILSNLTTTLAALFTQTRDLNRRRAWVVDGTLVPTRDHAAAAKSKNYRWSCNLQVLGCRSDLSVVEIAGGGPGNRNDVVHYRASSLPALCRNHARVLADGGYRGIPELVSPVFQGNRIRRDAAWRTHRRKRARVEHALARLKDWRVLRDHRRRGKVLATTARAVALLHNLRIAGLRDIS